MVDSISIRSSTFWGMRPASGRSSDSAAEASVLLNMAPMNRTLGNSVGSQLPS